MEKSPPYYAPKYRARMVESFRTGRDPQEPSRELEPPNGLTRDHP